MNFLRKYFRDAEQLKMSHVCLLPPGSRCL